MVEQDSNSPDTAVGSTGERWRPNATIDLKADEVRTEPTAETAPSHPSAQPAQMARSL